MTEKGKELIFIFYKELLQINKKNTGNLIENGQRICVIYSQVGFSNSY